MKIEFSQSTLDAINIEDGIGAGLPNEAYTSEDFFRAEQQQLFARTWTCIGNASLVPNAGDLLPIDWLGEPLVLVRNRNHQVKVFHNVCSHRGNELVWEACHARNTIQCPYHGWAYSFDGELLTTPNVGGSGIHQLEGLDKSRYNLHEVRTAVWMDLVFINLAENAPEFTTFIAPLQARVDRMMSPAQADELQPATDHGQYTIEFAGNWKLCVENNLESYHLPTVHPELNAVSRLEDHYHFYHDGMFAGQGTSKYDHEQTNLKAFPVFDGWPGLEAEYPTLYPNVFLGLQADHYWTRVVQPRSAGHSLDYLQIYYLGDAATSEAFEAARKHRLEVWIKVFNEDIGVVEGMQRGRQSSAFDGGIFTPLMDKPSQHFARWVAKQLTKAR